MMTSEAKGISQVKPRLGEGRAGIKWKKIFKFPVSQPLDKHKQWKLLPSRRPIIQTTEFSILQQPQNVIQSKTKLKILVFSTGMFYSSRKFMTSS